MIPQEEIIQIREKSYLIAFAYKNITMPANGQHNHSQTFTACLLRSLEAPYTIHIGGTIENPNDYNYSRQTGERYAFKRAVRYLIRSWDGIPHGGRIAIEDAQVNAIWRKFSHRRRQAAFAAAQEEPTS
ncbi:hypothetical protein ACFLZW_06115 [Chloroflexota bacterium]